jgi:alanyl-tRNA synthetase
VTDRLYYTDPYLTEFDAEVLGIEPVPGTSARAAVLDRTAFYPTSGGQPFDTGMLGSVRVVDAIDRDDGTILHVIDGDLSPGRVHGRIDWPRRFEHMQQHTGQHVLSAAFDHVLKARTVSFHLGSASSTIDLSPEVMPAGIARAEDEANRVVWEDRPVSIRFAHAAEAAELPLRKETGREGVLRLVEVEGFDLSACGGTHVRRTGAIGVIAVASWEKFRGGTRVEFLCGSRALRGYRTLRDAVTGAVRLISVLPSELPEGIERLQEDAKESKRRIKDLQARLASYDAEALAARAEERGALRVVVAALEDWDAIGLKAIASAIAARPAHAAILFSAPPPSSIVVARGEGVGLDSGAILKQIASRFGGKGGGRPELAQGGGAEGPLDEMLAFARSLF